MSVTVSAVDSGPAWIPRGTPMAEMVLQHDWASTSIGPMCDWPVALRTAVSVCLSSNFPLLVLWGPDLVKVYNDGYASMIGPDKHPRALGAPAREIWPEIWHQIGPMFESVVTTGVPTWSEHESLLIERHGFTEECYFTWSYSPLFGEDGSVDGVLDISVETTSEVVNQRRLACIADLNASLADVERPTEACAVAIEVFSRHPHDIVAADILLEVGGDLVTVASNRGPRSAGVTPGDARSALAARDALVIGRAREGAPAAHCVLPFGHEDGEARDGGVRGVLVASLNPMRPFDADHRRFLDVIGQTLGNVIDRVQRRAEALGQVQHVNETLQRAMLPRVTDSETFAARYLPAANHLSVGGDWYDVVELAPGRRAMVVGDCVGHDLEAATVMGQLRSAARALLTEGHGPAATVSALEAFSCSVPGAMGASVVCVISDRHSETLTYCRAGHPPPLLVAASGVQWLDRSGGPLLGVDPSAERTDTVLSYTVGDLLVLYSDGLVERRDRPPAEQTEHLAAVAVEHTAYEVAPLADLLLAELVTDDTVDDVVVVVKRLGGIVDDDH